MAQWTRDQFVTELQNRGWGRFATADLQKYLDFGLRDVMREFKWKSMFSIDTINQSTSFFDIGTSVSGTGRGRSLRRAYLRTAGLERKLEPATDEFFFETWLGLDLTKPENKGAPTRYYVYDEKVYFIPAPDQAYSIHLHWMATLLAFNGNSVSGLAERFDELILLAAEIYCFRRAREWEAMQIAKMELREKVLAEIVEDRQLWTEHENRVVPSR